MILKRQNMSENQWNHFKIVPLLTQSLSTVNCQFGEAAKFPFIGSLWQTDMLLSFMRISAKRHLILYLISHISFLSFFLFLTTF